MPKKSGKMEPITVNGTALWSRFGGRMVFARQLEPTAGLYEDKDYGALTTPILVGYDGEEGQELATVLAENEALKKRVAQLKEKLEQDKESAITDLYRHIHQLEGTNKKPWWRRG